MPMALGLVETVRVYVIMVAMLAILSMEMRKRDQRSLDCWLPYCFVCTSSPRKAFGMEPQDAWLVALGQWSWLISTQEERA